MPLMTWPFHPSLVSIAVESRNLLPFQTEQYRALHSRLNLIDGGLDLLKIGSFCNFIFDGVLASPNWFIGELLLPYYPQVAQDSVIASTSSRNTLGTESGWMKRHEIEVQINADAALATKHSCMTADSKEYVLKLSTITWWQMLQHSKPKGSGSKEFFSGHSSHSSCYLWLKKKKKIS